MQAKENFFEDVYSVVRLIPPGRVSTYGAIAHYLGSKRGARLVGWALNQSIASGVPAHRVVNRQGLLTGQRFFGETSSMEDRLAAEGVAVENGQVKDFAELFWDPALALG